MLKCGLPAASRTKCSARQQLPATTTGDDDVNKLWIYRITQHKSINFHQTFKCH